jgi:hypothetical protein
MANQNETGDWPDGIYQFEETDFVQGGIDGVDNLPLRQLAIRTAILRRMTGTHYSENKTGSTAGCVLAHTPVVDAAVQVFINRLLAVQNEDYVIVGPAITFTPPVAANDDVRVVYYGN